MPARLPLDDRLETAADLVVRARIFYDVWRFYEGAETRPAIINTMRLYREFFRFDPHAHLVSFIVHIAALFEKKRKDTINLPALAEELSASHLVPVQEAAVAANALLGQAASLASKVTLLRHKLFAHRDAHLSYSDAFTKANVTPNELRDLTELGLQAANRLLDARGLPCRRFDPLPLRDAEAMFSTLSRHPREWTA